MTARQKTYALLALVIIPLMVSGQSLDQNYIKSTIYKNPFGVHDRDNVPDSSKIVSITYFDGLGRAIQKIAHKQSANGKDIVQHIEYDSFGREAKKYLPYVNSVASLAYQPSALSETLNFYASPNEVATGNPNQEATANPYSRTFFEASPLGRVKKQAAPGDDWIGNENDDNDHTVKTLQKTNTVQEVRRFTAATTWSNSLELYEIALSGSGSDYYDPGQLYKTIIRDENWTEDSRKEHTTEEFRDKQGRVVLKRTFGKSEGFSKGAAHDTYYIYDEYGNLTYVLPPLVDTSNGVSIAELEGLCYQYRYDARNRIVEKKEPGSQWQYIVYDKLDRIVATGPSNAPFTDLILEEKKGWLVTKYDKFDRPVLTGWLYNEASIGDKVRADLQASYNAERTNFSEAATQAVNTIQGVNIFYTSNVIPTDGYHILTLNYYDDYRFTNVSFPAAALAQPVYYDNSALKPKGMTTGSVTTILEDSGSARIESAYLLYDRRARVVRAKKSNHMGGYTNSESKLNFAGLVQNAVTAHKKLDVGTEYVMKDFFVYSEQGRLNTHSHSYAANTPELMANNVYDELGQVITTYVGGQDLTGTSGYYQKVDYEYTIRGWLKSINKPDMLAVSGEKPDLFAMDLRYNSPYNALALYNGNISETNWITANDNVPRHYEFTFDAMNRLTNAIYQKSDDATFANSYGEQATYDKNGNIKSMGRNGELDDSSVVFNIDDMVYSYEADSNRLLKVHDLSGHPKGFKDDAGDQGDSDDDYEYDAKGNMVLDQNKGIARIFYNHLNLPVQIEFDSGDRILYIYNGAGIKVSKQIVTLSGVNTTDYMGDFQYLNGKLQFYQTASGYMNSTANGRVERLSYVFSYRDHLGNVRLNYGKNPKGTEVVILEENNYYPFGLKHNAYNYTYQQFRFDSENNLGIEEVPVDERANKYKYNGKEFQDELGLNMYAMDMRQYDPAIARWVAQDPVVHHNFSPYSAFDNNPVYWADPSGANASNAVTEENFVPYTDAAGNEVSWLDALAAMGIGTKTSGTTTSKVSADGLTDNQWIYASRPNSGDIAKEYKLQNKALTNFYQEVDALKGEILNFQINLLDRFEGSGIDPFERASQDDPLATVMNLIDKIKGLKRYYQLGGSLKFSFPGRSSENKRGNTTETHIQIFSSAFSENFWLASTLFHEITHAIQDRIFGVYMFEAERQAYSTEWRLGSGFLRKTYDVKYNLIWRQILINQ